MKRFTKRLAAILLAAALFAGFTGASASGSTTIQLTPNLVSPTYNVVLPTNFDFWIDPFASGAFEGSPADDGFSIYSRDFVIMNRSNVPVRVDVVPTLTLASGVTQATPADVTAAELDSNNEQKIFEVYMAVAAANTVTGDFSDTGISLSEDKKNISGDTVVYSNDGVVFTKITTGKNDTRISFAFKNANCNGNVFDTLNPDSVTAFAMRGHVNPNASWKGGDIKMAAKITFAGISGTTYDKLTDPYGGSLSTTMFRVFDYVESGSKPV